jgi:hypothetical protein
MPLGHGTCLNGRDNAACCIRAFLSAVGVYKWQGPDDMQARTAPDRRVADNKHDEPTAGMAWSGGRDRCHAMEFLLFEARGGRSARSTANMTIGCRGSIEECWPSSRSISKQHDCPTCVTLSQAARGSSPGGKKNRYTQSTHSFLDVIFLGKIKLEFDKTK